MVDKNLFLHDLSVVAMLKDEGHYLKEWLDYHLLAGVDHFYLYDHESTDNQAEVAKPYIEAGLVDYFYTPGEAVYHVAYNDAIKRFKFQNRYMAFIDGDEFIFPKSNRSIAEVVDEILSHDSNAGGLGFHWQIFGTNGQETADYSRGVLERFTRRAPNNYYIWPSKETNNYALGNCYIKNIVNPRKISFFYDPHTMNYFEGFYTVDERSIRVYGSTPLPIVTDKIVINHYYTKSREEYFIRKNRLTVDSFKTLDNVENLFALSDRNEVFDDSILKYRLARAENFSIESRDEKFARVIDTLTETLTTFNGDMETALTCRAMATYLREQFPDNEHLKVYEEASLVAILKSFDNVNLADARLFLRELPNLLSLPYPVVKGLRNVALQLVPQIKEVMHLNRMWRDFVELDYINDLLKLENAL